MWIQPQLKRKKIERDKAKSDANNNGARGVSLSCLPPEQNDMEYVKNTQVREKPSWKNRIVEFHNISWNNKKNLVSLSRWEFDLSWKPSTVWFFHTCIGKELYEFDMIEKICEDKKIDRDNAKTE